MIAHPRAIGLSRAEMRPIGSEETLGDANAHSHYASAGITAGGRWWRIWRTLSPPAESDIFLLAKVVRAIDFRENKSRMAYRVPRVQTQRLRCLQGDPQRKRGGK